MLNAAPQQAVRFTIIPLMANSDSYSQPEEQRLFFSGPDAQEISIGRSPSNSIQLPNPNISGLHATVTQQGQQFFLLDNNSSNGTYIDGERLPPEQPIELKHGSYFRIVGYSLQFHCGESIQELQHIENTTELMRDMVDAVLRGMGAAEEVPPRLLVLSGQQQGQLLDLTQYQDYLIGRSIHSSLSLPDSSISREHLKVSRELDGISIVDPGSRNGTKLNNIALRPNMKYYLQHDDQLTLGDIQVSFYDPQGAQLGQQVDQLGLFEKAASNKSASFSIPKPSMPPPKPTTPPEDGSE